VFTGFTIGIIFLVVLGFLFVGRRVLRLAVKLAIAGVLILLLIAGVTVGWWRGWFGPSSSAARPTSQREQGSNQRPNSNRRSSSH
jgi:ABC-type uncharacterized transport system permease subunit